jgi:hypothetical protein
MDTAGNLCLYACLCITLVYDSLQGLTVLKKRASWLTGGCALSEITHPAGADYDLSEPRWKPCLVNVVILVPHKSIKTTGTEHVFQRL